MPKVSIPLKDEDPLYLMLDYETRSEADLKLVGAFEYAAHPSTEVLCVAWRLGTRETLEAAETVSWNVKLSPRSKKRLLLIEALNNPKVIVVAHNAGFEGAITELVLQKHL